MSFKEDLRICRICGSREFRLIYKYKDTPLGEDFVSKKNVNKKTRFNTTDFANLQRM